jgi:hypothetical protein
VPACKRLVCLLSACLLAPLLARADYTDDYIAGLAALDHGRYAQAEQYLERALGAKSGSVSWVTIQGSRQPYLPHHFLGMAKFRRGDCAAAGAQWNDADNVRALARLRALRTEEEQLLAQCSTSTVVAASAPTTPASSSAPVTAPAAATVPEDSSAAQAPATASSTQSPSTQVPATLSRAFDDYLGARYERVAKLDADGMPATAARYQAYLLRAAAHYALARLGGGKSQLDAARRDARAAWAVSKADLDERVFSPAFRDFYASAH